MVLDLVVVVTSAVGGCPTGTLALEVIIMVESVPHHPVTGIHRDDIAHLTRVLDGCTYPARKWQLIGHAARDPRSPHRADPRTSSQLWALPAGRYTSLARVLAAAARTARSHPGRTGMTRLREQSASRDQR